jgi:hypothetical protein
MPAMSLYQPYASLIAAGAKRYETRDFAPPQRLLGKRIAIHAAKRVPRRGELGEDVEAAIGGALGRDDWFGRDGLPLGAVVCTAVLDMACRVASTPDTRWWAQVDRICTRQSPEPYATYNCGIQTDLFGDYSIGRWCWELMNVQVLPDPIPARGRQMIGWPWSGTYGLAP